MKMMVKVKTSIFIILLIVASMVVVATAMVAVVMASQNLTLPGCDEKCGNLNIPYPFGTRKECYLNEDFNIYCNNSSHSPQALLFDQDSNLIITNISITGEVHIQMFTAFDCYTINGPDTSDRPYLNLTRFTVSNTKNKFTAIGCDTQAFIEGTIDGNPYKSGCMALCETNLTVRDGTCAGNGCCQIELPEGLKDLEMSVDSFENHSRVLSFNPCGYAFVIDNEKFHFSSKYIHEFREDRVPMVLDWAIGNDTCLKAKNKTNCICGDNSRRFSFLNNGSEYRCECLEGYQGNPYLPQGCQDINECQNKELNKCKYGCKNTIGNYTCPCPKGYRGDARSGGDGCTPKPTFVVQIVLGIGVGLIVMVIGSIWTTLGYRKWKFIKLKQKFFEQNGGLMLRQHITRLQGTKESSSSSSEVATIFTHLELKKATNNFDEKAIAGKGGYGTVYKGVLENRQTVAIKKSKLVDQSQIEQFINEVIILSQINHRNVVKLLGCCLETEVPLLVYEFISNGTLYDHIHNRKANNENPLPWETRLKIASETAGVLSYLHSSASTPIIHRDIKPTNILLDENFTAKVSDFGSSKLVPMDHTQLSTMVQGTLGYLDPEYLSSSELTEKSDVYSFGIVLVELLTGKKAISFEGSEVKRILATYFIAAMKEDRLVEVIEKNMINETNFKDIKEVAKLAMMCLRVKGDERPTMKEVAMELEGIRIMMKNPNDDEIIYTNKSVSHLENTKKGHMPQVAEEEDVFGDASSCPITMDSMKAQVRFHVKDGR